MMRWVIVGMIFLLTMVPTSAEEVFEWKPKAISDPLKAWTISFNQAVREDSVNTKTVYIFNEKQQRVPATLSLSPNLTSVTIQPRQELEVGKTYQLVVEHQVFSETNQSLGKDVVMRFTVIEKSTPSSPTKAKSETEKINIEETKKNQPTSAPPAPASTKVEHFFTVSQKTSDYVTELVVTPLKSSVVKVTVNGKVMQYHGKNQFKLGIPEGMAGNAVILSGYSSNGDFIGSEQIEIGR